MGTAYVNLTSLYDFDYTLYRLSFDPLIALNKQERWVDVPVIHNGEKYVVRVQATGTTFEPSFKISIDQGTLCEQLLNHIYHLFAWDVDLTAIQNQFKGTNLEKLFDAYPGTPIVKDFDLYYCLMKTIIHQQLNMKFAFVLSTRFVELLGERHDGVWFYPTPEKVANTAYEDLRALQFSQRKAEYVIDTSRKITEGSINLSELSTLDDTTVLKELGKVRGIGPWTVENWMMFGLGRKNLFPIADIGLKNAMKHYFNLEKKPTVEEMLALSKNWPACKSYAALTLWRSIE